MLPHSSLIIVAIAFLATPSSSLYSPRSDVVQLTGVTFNQKVLDSDGVWLVEFFAPWCGHCRSLVPEYEKAAKALRGIIKVGAVDMDQDENKPLAGKYRIEGFPTIKLFAGGKVEDFNGARTADALVEAAFSAAKRLARKTLGGGSGDSASSPDGAVIELTDSNFRKLVVEHDEPMLVEFFAPWCGHCKNLAPHWAKAAKELQGKGMRLGALDATVHAAKAQEYGINGYPTIKYFAGGRASPVDYDGGRTASDIVAWAMERVAANLPAPEVHELVSGDALKVACDSSPLCVITFLPHIFDCQSKCRRDYLEIVAQLGEKHKTKQWGWLWSEAGAQMDIEAALNVGGFGYPTMVVVNVKKQKFTQLRGAFSKGGLQEFLRDLSYGKSSNTATLREGALDKVQTIAAWDGNDREMPIEEDIDLSDVDLDEVDNKEEL